MSNSTSAADSSIQGILYQHVDGGIYRFMNYAKSATDDSEMIVYEHVWPFEKCLWVIAQDEFERQFTQITESQLDNFIAKYPIRAQAQAAIDEVKCKRRALEFLKGAGIVDKSGTLATQYRE